MSWKKSFSMGVVIPHKMRNCCARKEDNFCDKYDELVYQKKKITPNLDELKREAPNQFGHMLPNYRTS